jgi:aspartyl-tRNA(Asn)/glutamyl-tRNA(Gln) amidotransferase subunit C
MVNKKEVEHVAALARIAVSDADKELISQQLSKILDYIDQLKEADVEKVEPLRGLHTDQQVLRKDEAKPCDCRQDILANAPSIEADCFKVPPVIE